MPLNYEPDQQLIALSKLSAGFLDAFPIGGGNLNEKLKDWIEEVTPLGLFLVSEIGALKGQWDLSENNPDEFLKFIKQLRYFEDMLVREAYGVDHLTRLMNSFAIKKSMAREMERLARGGKPFSLAIARIDNFKEIVESEGEEGANEYEKIVAKLIAESLRPFDDGYRTMPGEFTFSLKQSESSGGVKALERLRIAIEDKNVMLKTPIKGRNFLSLSCRVAEPVDGDNIPFMISNLRADIENSDGAVDTVFEYQDISPLQRFVQDQ